MHLPPLFFLFYAIFFQFMLESLTPYLKRLSCLGDIAVCLEHLVGNDLLLQRAQILVQSHALAVSNRRLALDPGVRHVEKFLRQDVLIVRHGHGLLYDILKFTDVAGIVVGFKLLESLVSISSFLSLKGGIEMFITFRR